MNSSRTIVNSITGEQIHFVKTCHETNGEYLLIEVNLPPKGEGPPLHYHLAFEELFEVIDGELTVQINNEERILRPGEKLLVDKKTNHRFRNTSDQPVSFYVTLTPGHQFEESMRIAYGLIADGKINKKGFPQNFFHLSMILKMQDTNLAGVPLFIQKFIFGNASHIGKLLGMDKSLKNIYVDVK